MAMGDQKVLDPIQHHPAGFDVLEKLNLGVAAPCVDKGRLPLGTDKVHRRVFRGSPLPAAHLKNVLSHLIKLSV
jgi:hypothetical protein